MILFENNIELKDNPILVVDLILSAKERGITLFLEDGKLKYNCNDEKAIEGAFLTELRLNKEAIISFLENEIVDISNNPNPSYNIKKAERPEQIPLSYGQERLWFTEQLKGGSQFNIPIVYRFKGDLDQELLEKSFRSIINRHEILRTVYLENAGQPYQLVLENNNWQLQYDELINSAENQVADFIKMEIERPFDLTQDFMVRARLVKVKSDEHLLVLVLHHIATDGWSVPIMISELVESYKAMKIGAEVNLPDLALQYADYAIWQRNPLNELELDRQLDYWEDKLTGVEPLDIPTDFSRPSIQSSHGQTLWFKTDSALQQKLQRLAKQEDVTMFMLLLSIFKVFLARYTGQTDVTVGTPIANRIESEIAPLIGFFVNNLALRDDLGGNPAFKALLAQVKATTLDAYTYQGVPFEKIVNRIEKNRQVDRSPIFQVMFTLQNNSSAENSSFDDQLILTKESFSNNQSKYDLTVLVNESEDGLNIGIEYCTDLFSTETINRLMVHYEQLMQSVVLNPKNRIENLQMIHPKEQELLLNTFSGAKVAYPENKTIIDLFDEQVKATPDKVAIEFGGDSLSYRQLEEKSNQLAHYLIDKGIKKDSLVGICLNRSLEMIIGLLGILKSGGAYVPIDSEYPEERIKFILQDTAAPIVLCTGTEVANLEFADIDTTLIALDQDWSEIEEMSSSTLPRISRSQDLMYVIYTSGSTGKPKGVMKEHRSVVNRLLWAQDYFNLNPAEDVVLQKTTFCFDVSVWELFWPLISGVKMVLAAPEGHRDNTYLRDRITSSNVTTIHFVPSMLEAFLLDAPAGLCPNLKRVICSGEALKTNHVDLFREKLPHVSLHNLYGPTEAAIDVTAWDVPLEGDLKKVLIGKPVANTSLYVLNASGQHCGIGVIGELYISGIQVARGYLNREALTAERFVADPFDQHSQARMYKTGDLARWLPDGNIEYLGRKDHQVKIRGFRIELEEIEAVLNQHPTVKQNVVVVKKDAQQLDRLVAFIVNETPINQGELKSYLKSQLPEYMIPSIFVETEELPLTHNGKINRKALPEVDFSTLLNKEYIAPRNEMEQCLERIWKDLLGLEQVGIHDNFFELGGHSLLATRVASAIKRDLGLDIAIKDLFAQPTISELRGFLQGADASESTLPEIQVFERPDKIPLSFSQEQLWFIDKLSGSTHYHVPVILRFNGAMDKDILEKSFQAITNRHEILRTTYYEENGKPLQSVMDRDLWKLNYSVAKDLDEQKQKELILNEIKNTFDLEKDHSLRAHLVKLSSDEYLLIIVMHHIAIDGWSKPIFINELTEFYRSFTKNVKPNLADLPIQYIDYALWQQQYLSGPILDQKLAYWSNKLSELQHLDMPLDFPRPAVQSIKGRTIGFRVGKEITHKLNAICDEEGVTMFILLLTAFNVMLCKYTGQDDIIIGTPTANRPQVELENLIGFFINTLALRNDLGDNPIFKDLLGQVKNNTLEAYSHQEVPFEKIVEVVEKGRDLTRTPVFQVMFALQNAISSSDESIEVENDLTFSNETFASTTSQFDFTLNVKQTKHYLDFTIEYCTDLFLYDTMDRMGNYFKTLLSNIVYNFERPIDQLSMLDVKETSYLLDQLSSQTSDSTQEGSIIDLFEQQVTKTPSNTALIFEDQKYTYKELNEITNQFANFLNRKEAISKETLIGLQLKRNDWSLIALLGILKAGAAYVPIDLNYPIARTEYILKDSAVEIVVNQTLINAFIQEQGQYSKSNLNKKIQANQLAYVIYTSGSTGFPKGCLIEHKSVVSLATAQINTFKIDEKEVILQLSNFAFDASVEQIFIALLSGGALCIAPQELILEPEGIERIIEEHQVTHLHTVPSLLETIECKSYTYLKRAISGGDVCKPSTAKKWSQYCDFYNEYGPTETCVTSLEWKYCQDEALPIAVPIGKPLSNTSAYVLDENLSLVPQGVVGELFIGGIGVAREYLNQPELTSQKFIPNPYQPSERLYRTGDLVRWLPNGNFAFVGRKDNQVKINGYRVELGEIEANLKECVNVVDCAAKLIEMADGNYGVAAYIVSLGNFEEDSILSYLKIHLPDYMVPAFLIEIEQIPLLSNGKINKKALPKPVVNETTQHNYVAPRLNIEQQVANVWQDLLNIDNVGIHDDFFRIGGHSLLAVKMMSKLKDLFDLDLKIAELFESSTIYHLGAKIVSKVKAEDSAKLVAINKYASNQPKIFCVPGAEGNIMAFAELGAALENKINLYAFQPKGIIGLAHPDHSVEIVAANYIKKMMEMQPTGPYNIAGYSFGGQVAYEITKQLKEQGEEVNHLFLIDANAPGLVKIPTKTKLEWLIVFSQLFAKSFGKELEIDSKVLIDLAEYDQLLIVKDYLFENGIEVSASQLSGFFNVFVNNITSNYRPNPVKNTSDFAVTLFKTINPGDSSDNRMMKESQIPECLGWTQFTNSKINMVSTASTHWTIMRSSSVKKIANQMVNHLVTSKK